MNNISKKKLTKLYTEGMSMRQIALNIKCSEHKVAYWMTKYGIERRKRSEANYVFYNPNGDPFEIKTGLTIAESVLYGMGLGIYWGEGDKASRHQVRVTNTDPDMVKVFTKFLINICQVRKEKIGYYLISFNDSDLKSVANFWSEQLQLAEDKFGKITQISPQGKGTYRKKSQFGVCSVVVSNVKLKTWIMQELQVQRI